MHNIVLCMSLLSYHIVISIYKYIDQLQHLVWKYFLSFFVYLKRWWNGTCVWIYNTASVRLRLVFWWREKLKSFLLSAHYCTGRWWVGTCQWLCMRSWVIIFTLGLVMNTITLNNTIFIKISTLTCVDTISNLQQPFDLLL